MINREAAKYRAQYEALGHAMQTGVKIYTAKAIPEHPELLKILKDIRVGVNMAMIDSAAVVGLLVEKGLIDEAEYFKKLAELLEREVKMYEDMLKSEYNVDIKLA